MRAALSQVRGLAFCAALSLCGSIPVLALDYSSTELVLGVRKEGATYELVVNLGPATRFKHIPAGTSVTITDYSAEAVAALFENTSDLKWSVLGTVNLTAATAELPWKTAWMTRARAEAELQSTPWSRRNASSMGMPSQQIDSIGSSSQLASSTSGYDPLYNSDTAIRIEVGNALRLGYSAQVGVNGDLAGSWPGSVEQLTASDFADSDTVSRADLYEVMPSPPSGKGTYLGYFELKPDGTMSFTAAGGGTEPQKPVITWSNPADITYGAALGEAQLNATASAAGTFAYTPAAGTVLPAGTGQTLSVLFTPTDTAAYTNATATVTVNVLKATPEIVWANPADIAQGTALGEAQLNAMANTPGTFTYDPPVGTVLPAGADQMLSVSFVPNDSANYNPANKTVKITVLGAVFPPRFDSSKCRLTAQGFQIEFTGQTGESYDLLVSSDCLAWTRLEVVVPVDGRGAYLDAAAGLGQRFYRVTKTTP